MCMEGGGEDLVFGGWMVSCLIFFLGGHNFHSYLFQIIRVLMAELLGMSVLRRSHTVQCLMLHCQMSVSEQKH